MAQDLFRVEIGLADDNVHYLSGAGAPSGSYADAAPVGSSWSNTTNGDKYTKTASGWVQLASGTSTATIQTEIDAIETAVGLQTDGTLAWGYTPENFLATDKIVPAIQKIDQALTIAETAAATAQTTADSKVSKAGDTMTGNLAFTGGATVTGLPTPVNASDAANKSYVDTAVNGLVWLPPVNSIGAGLPGTASVGERRINTTTGKIHTATALNTWDDGVNPVDGNAVFDKSTETGYVYSGTAWVQFTGAGQIDAGNALLKTGNLLDVVVGDGLTVENDMVEFVLATAGGLSVDNNGLSVVVDDASIIINPVTNALEISADYRASLDEVPNIIDQLAAARTETSQLAVTSITLDSVNTNAVSAVKWIVYAASGEAPIGKVQVHEILAVHNGIDNAGAATQVDFTSYAKLKIGGNIVGLTFNVVLAGSAPSQTINLNVTSTETIDVRAVREVIFASVA